MKLTYFQDDDTLVIRLSDKPIAREVSQDWRTHVSYAADGTAVETVSSKPASAALGRCRWSTARRRDAVAHTERDGATRVISFRRASREEREAYDAWLEDEFDDA